MNVNLNIGVVLRHMAEKRLTSAALAKRAGLSPQGLSGILRRGNCTAINAGRLADALGVGVELIMEGGADGE